MKPQLPDWTERQREVIEAPPEARQYVVAGPGTGKTAVACGRVAWLAGLGITPSSILMFSFTRAAVAEMRSRIVQFSGNEAVTSVRISTLDSTAWHFRYGTGTDFENLSESFDKNIEETIRLLEEGNDVLSEYLEATNHLIIDESQDLTADRAKLVSTLIREVPAHCGVTVFADPCQAIYGFTNDYSDGTDGNGLFIDMFDFRRGKFLNRKLERVHRTQEEAILGVFDATRSVVENGSDPSDVVSTIQDTASALDGDLSDELDETCLVLYRRRAQALNDAQYYPYYCRLRMSGLPPCIHPWIGAVLYRCTDEVIQLGDFVDLWEDVHDIDSLLCHKIDSSEAWNLLHRHAAAERGGINLVRLRELLCRPKPHADFLIPDFGMWGPVFGTIHGSKGREADNVVLMLPRNYKTLVIPDDQPNYDRRNAEEARVYYVGVSRARDAIEHAFAPSLKRASSVRSGRVWHTYNINKGTKVQFGIQGDVDELALVSRQFCKDRDEAHGNMEALLAIHRKYVNSEEDVPAPVDLHLENVGSDGQPEWRYRMRLNTDDSDGEQTLGWMSRNLGYDLFAVGKEVGGRFKKKGLKPPTKVVAWNEQPALKMIGIRTVAVPPDGNDLVHEPFASSGFLLAPVVFGFPTIFFRK